MFQPQTLTIPLLGYVTYCYRDYLLNPPLPIFLPPDVRPGGQPTPAPHPQISIFVLLRYSIILPYGSHPYPSQNTKNLHPPPPYQLLPESDSSSPPSPLPHLPNYRRYRSLTTAKIFFKVAFSCCSAYACHRHGSWSPPFPVACLFHA